MTQAVNTTQKKVLLCDAAFSAMPLLEALKAARFHVAVTSGRPQDPCHALAHQSLPIDYSDRQALQELVREHRFDFIVPGCTDISYLAASTVARALGLPGFDREEIVNVIHDKGLFREYAQKQGYPIPRATGVMTDAVALAFPILIKPVDSFSGKGIEKVDTPAELDASHQQAIRHSPSGQVLFEEFVEGRLYSHSAFLRNGAIDSDFFVSEYCTVHPYQVNSSCMANRLDPVVKQKMRGWLTTFAQHADLCDGLVHTQFISRNGEIWLIESTRRCPGDLYSRLIATSTGVDYAALYVSGFCGSADRAGAPVPQSRPISRHTVSLNEDCHFVDTTLSLPNVALTYVPIRKTGEFLRAAPFDRAGIYFIEHASLEVMEATTEQIVRHVVVNRTAA
ncbi:MAG: carbamoyl-phosphate synthase small subunit [Herminiimonas sp.]|nr:carbamoyl-phosphate synthase small subunit [Herminiimonas sp.]